MEGEMQTVTRLVVNATCNVWGLKGGYIPHSRKNLQGLKFMTFAIGPHYQSFHFINCCHLNRTRQIFNKITNF